MLQLLLTTLCILATPTLVGCAKDKNDPTPSSVTRIRIPEPTDVTENFELKPENAAEYFSKFQFKPSTSCESPWFKEAGTFSFHLGADEKGRSIDSDISLMILADGTYHAFYKETVLGKRNLAGIPVLEEETTKIKSNWRIDGKSIVFENLGRGAAAVVDGRRTIQLKLERDLLRPGLAGRTIAVTGILTNVIPVNELDNCANVPAKIAGEAGASGGTPQTHDIPIAVNPLPKPFDRMRPGSLQETLEHKFR